MFAFSGRVSANSVRVVRSGFSVLRAVRLMLPARLRIASTRGGIVVRKGDDERRQQKLGPFEHVRVGLGRDQVFESRKVPLLGVVFDGVERSKAHRGIVGGELEADQKWRPITDCTPRLGLSWRTSRLVAVPSPSPLVMSMSVRASASGSST